MRLLYVFMRTGQQSKIQNILTVHHTVHLQLSARIGLVELNLISANISNNRISFDGAHKDQWEM